MHRVIILPLLETWKLPSSINNQIDLKAETGKQNWLSSYVVLALIAVAASNAAAFALLKHDRFDSPNHCWAYWRTRAWQIAQQSQRKPDAVFFGSSLMVSVVDDGDASYLDKSLDSLKNNGSRYFQFCAEKTLGKPFRTHSFAIGGQMASDTLALFRATIAKDKARPLLVWGIGPRDLLDSSFSDAATTETVRYLDRVLYPQDVLPESKPFWKQCERQIERGIFLYGKRSDSQCLERQLAEQLIGQTIGTKFDTIHAPKPLLRLAAAQQPEENAQGEWIVAPYRQKAARLPYWTDNSKEYAMRYQPFKAKLFASQCQYLDKFLAEAHQMGFPVMLVNMPILKENSDLLPPGVYDKYVSCISQSARKNGATFVDCNSMGAFTRKDFCDPVHLHGLGAQKFLRIVANRLKNVSDNNAIAGNNTQF